MPKVLRINSNVVTIGYPNGKLEDHDIREFNYTPSINDIVRVYGTDMPIITKDDHADDGYEQTSYAEHNTYNYYESPTDQDDVYGKKVNRIVYVLFCFFLGDFGVHEFYAGHVGAGILSIVFFWTGIPQIIAIFKGISALFKKGDAYGNIIV